MTKQRPKEPSIGTWIFVALVVVAALLLLFLGKTFYDIAGSPSNTFYTKLAELTLQLAVIVIVGALIKVVVDWGMDQHRRHLEKREDQMDFMRRVRAMHVTIKNAGDFLNAHNSGKTYVEQLKNLMLLQTDVEEISEDLRAASQLFKEQKEIRDGLEEIITYLGEAREEYIKHHKDVDSDAKAGKALDETIKQQKMEWVQDFMVKGKHYQEKYGNNLDKTKGKMRSEVYGANDLQTQASRQATS